MAHRAVVIAFLAILFGGLSVAQEAPHADLPNPYQTIDIWGTLPAGRKWGGISALDVDRDGQSVWVAERCGGQSCADSPLAPILKLDRCSVRPVIRGRGCHFPGAHRFPCR